MRTIITILIFTLAITQSAPARSLWTKESKVNGIMTGANASQVGEILTIVIQEDNRANDTADGEGKRSDSFSGIISTLWNASFMNKVFNSGPNDNGLAFQFNSQNDFKGETEVERESRFTSRVAATIVRIDEVGNYLIEARKTIRIGAENKTIILSGKVRPRDVSQNNTVLSYQVADAEISYLGDGVVTKMSNPTIIQRIFGFLF